MEKIQIREQDVPENLYWLYEIVGMDKFREIIDAAGGELVYLPLRRTLCREQIREQIRAEYDGENVAELANRYSYSERYIRSIIFE